MMGFVAAVTREESRVQMIKDHETSAANTDSASDRLQALGLALPELRENPYYVHHRTVGSSIYISGQLPYRDG